MARIVLDAGHGGRDPGAIGKTLQEKAVNLSLAYCLKMSLERMGYSVYMTRYRDEYIRFATRIDVANREEADLFISLHCNGHQNLIANGVETYHFPGSKKGTPLAEAIQKELVVATGLRNRGVKGAAYYVLRRTKMPAALVELAFITNPSEEELLSDMAFLVSSANAIAFGVRNYLKGGN